MESNNGKHFFRNSAWAMKILYLALGVVTLYCLLVVFLPHAVSIAYKLIDGLMVALSFGNEDMLMFNRGFFWACTASLVVIGCGLKIRDAMITKTNAGSIESYVE